MLKRRALGTIGLAVTVGLVSGTAAAEVYKCRDLSGKVTYSGTPCLTAGEAMPGSKLNGNAVAPTIESRSGEADRPAHGTASTSLSSKPAQCSAQADVRDIDVRLSSQIYSTAERQFLADEKRRVVNCDLASLTAEERKTRDEALRALGKDDRPRSLAAQRTVEALYDRHLTDEGRSARALEAARSQPYIYIDNKPYIPAKGGVIDPTTGRFCPQSGNWYVCS